MLRRSLLSLLRVALAGLFACSVWFTHAYVTNRAIEKVAREMNSGLNDIFSHSILQKYLAVLQKVPTHVGSNPYHINLAIKLRAEFMQALHKLHGVELTLYNSDGAVMFTAASHNDDDVRGVVPLTSEKLEVLRGGDVTFKRVSYGSYTSVFPIVLAQTGEPVVFLQITKDFSDVARFFSNTNMMFIIPTSLAFVMCVALTVVVYRKNAKLLSSQYSANLELQEKKETAEKESISKSQFLANVSHELRTPLNSIIGFSEIIQSESLGPLGHPQYKEYVQDIYGAGVHLLSLINDILDFTKAEDNKLSIELVRCDLGKIIESCCSMMLPKALEAKVELKQNMPDSRIVLLADARRMKQVILNLMSNSVKFTPENGFVKLSVEVKDGQVVIEISDNGIGIARQDLYKVMSVFGQADSAHSRRYEGTGLGLPLSKRLVELMNGTFSLSSELNQGTVVTLTFPCVEELDDSEKAF
ncbi:sensor histidine kinase [Candidatus Anaplasma sp. TIGMIC]|uniref:sensor histidine kinase n=1 Tax=Candidatus Anaplasma sp. TIGMIC TaxID=3020713 RepID=UPI00232CC234|nr:HAMP domain-containing sensor histidine kinase [Candidatus Anaplasma sp. TIGMIC]MDB1135053.1 HAMP domain-containing sensor histidine kinase [Candidatus Anaplasma sp. TIGMIC]